MSSPPHRPPLARVPPAPGLLNVLDFTPPGPLSTGQLDGLCISSPVPSYFPTGPSSLASSSSGGPNSSQMELLCSLNASWFPMPACLPFRAQLRCHFLGTPSLEPRLGQDLFFTFTMSVLLPSGPGLPPLLKGPPTSPGLHMPGPDPG